VKQTNRQTNKTEQTNKRRNRAKQTKQTNRQNRQATDKQTNKQTDKTDKQNKPKTDGETRQNKDKQAGTNTRQPARPGRPGVKPVPHAMRALPAGHSRPCRGHLTGEVALLQESTSHTCCKQEDQNLGVGSMLFPCSVTMKSKSLNPQRSNNLGDRKYKAFSGD
jgi:hypothetical protein